MLFFKPSCCLESSLVDFGLEGIDVGGMFLQGDGAARYKVYRRHYGVRGRLKVGGFGYVKREDGVSSCDGEVW
jgi:hypothetical protein